MPATAPRVPWSSVGAAAALAAGLLACVLVSVLALYLIHGGGSPAPPGPPAGVTVAPAGD